MTTCVRALATRPRHRPLRLEARFTIAVVKTPLYEGLLRRPTPRTRRGTSNRYALFAFRSLKPSFVVMNLETLFQLLSLGLIVAAGPLIVILLSTRAESGL